MPLRPQVRQLQAAGRRGDELLGHLTPGELVLPQSLQSPTVVASITQDARRKGINPSSLMAGSKFSSINPATGLPEFADQEGHEQTFQELIAQIVERARAISDEPQLPGAPLPEGPAVPPGTEVPFSFGQVTDFNKFGFGPEAILRDPNLIPGTNIPRGGDNGSTEGSAGDTTIVDLLDFFSEGGDDIGDDEVTEDNRSLNELSLSEIEDRMNAFAALDSPIGRAARAAISFFGGLPGTLASGLISLAQSIEERTIEGFLGELNDPLGAFGITGVEPTIEDLDLAADIEAITGLNAPELGFTESFTGPRSLDPFSPFGFDLDAIADAEAAAAGIGGVPDPEEQGFTGFEDPPAGIEDDFGPESTPDPEEQGFGGFGDPEIGGQEEEEEEGGGLGGEQSFGTGGTQDFDGRGGTPSDPGQDPEGGFGDEETGGSPGGVGSPGGGSPGGSPGGGTRGTGSPGGSPGGGTGTSGSPGGSPGGTGSFGGGGLIGATRKKSGKPVMIKAHEGEFVIPRHVVDIIGLDALNEFINSFQKS